MVLRTDATICVSRLARGASRGGSEAAGKIHHLPHGTPASFLAESPYHQPAMPPDDLGLRLPRPLLGYVGSIEGRVDWALLYRLSEAFPHASLVLVGDPPRHVAGTRPGSPTGRDAGRDPTSTRSVGGPMPSFPATIAPLTRS